MFLRKLEVWLYYHRKVKDKQVGRRRFGFPQLRKILVEKSVEDVVKGDTTVFVALTPQLLSVKGQAQTWVRMLERVQMLLKMSHALEDVACVMRLDTINVDVYYGFLLPIQK